MATRGWEHVKVSDLHVKAQPKPRKYRNQPTIADGHRFDSKREAARYHVLALEQRAGLITELELQPKFPLHTTNPHGVKVEIGIYRADFAYRRNGERVIEDSKGMRGERYYQLRKRIAEAEYGIVVVEV